MGVTLQTFDDHLKNFEKVSIRPYGSQNWASPICLFECFDNVGLKVSRAQYIEGTLLT